MLGAVSTILALEAGMSEIRGKSLSVIVVVMLVVVELAIVDEHCERLLDRCELTLWEGEEFLRV